MEWVVRNMDPEVVQVIKEQAAARRMTIGQYLKYVFLPTQTIAQEARRKSL